LRVFVHEANKAAAAASSNNHPRGEAQRSRRRDLQKCDYPIQEQIQIVKLFNSPYPLYVDSIIQIEVFIVYMERLVCT
jgi:hypothetical protein